MHLEDAGLWEQPFHQRGPPLRFVRYQSQQAAFRFLRNVLRNNQSIGLLQGPESSGKSVLIRQYVNELPPNLAVAVVDGTRLNASHLLSNILAQFGYETTLDSTDEFLNMLKVFLVHQTRRYRAPVLVLENISHIYPSALCALCKLASLTVQNRFALRIILVSSQSIQRILDSPGMRSVTDRVVGDFLLGPLTANESLNYLYNKLRASGAAQPDNIFPVDVCDELHALSGGWPGKLDGMAKSTIDNADRLPIQLNNVVGSGSGKQLNYREDVIETLQQTENVPPKLMVTINGETLQEIELRAPKTLIGRSVLSDVFINSKFISKHHALLIHVQNTILLVDLKSTNGTLVNSRKIQSRILRPDDIISLGNHRIKVVYPNSRPFVDIEDPKDIDTVAMKNVADARRAVTNEELRFSNMNKQIEGFSLNSGR